MGKIKKLEELSIEHELAKNCNMKVGLCHGIFDLVHYGHLEHFRKAKEQCDFLVVSITPNKFINKGPDRPYFGENIRIKHLSHIDYIDAVVINNDESACDIIEILKPDFYFKGSEYRDKEDVTGKIQLEKDCVEKYGGQLVFTDEQTFSSTNLINSNLQVYTDKQKEYREYIKNKYSIEDIKFWLDKLKSLNVMIVGDPIVDVYKYVNVKNIAMKSPNISTEYVEKKVMDGGTNAIANHVNNFVNLVYCSAIANFGVVKNRFLAKNYRNQKLFEYCSYLHKEDLDEYTKDTVNYVEENIDKVDLILITDFGHGYVTKEIADKCFNNGKFVAVNVQTNSANFGFNYITKYKFFDFASLDERELRLPFSDNESSVDDLVMKLKLLTSCNKFLVTLGELGLNYYTLNNEFDFNLKSKYKVDNAVSFENIVVDALGAGDAVFAISSLLTFVDCPTDLIAFIANCAGAIDTKIVGNENYITYPNIYSYMKGIIS